MVVISVEFVVCPTHISMCFRFQRCINKQLPPSVTVMPGCTWGFSVVITDHLIIITTIKNESVQACDVRISLAERIILVEMKTDSTVFG